MSHSMVHYLTYKLPRTESPHFLRKFTNLQGFLVIIIYTMNRPIKFLVVTPFALFSLFSPTSGESVLAEHELSLENRYEDRWVNEVFKDNILLNLAYLRGARPATGGVNWDEVKKPFDFEFKLDPNQTFAYHDDTLPKYEGRVVKTTNAHFNAQEGFRSSGYLFGDGVCHLASLIYWVALDAGLEAEAPTNHNFMAIPDVPKEYGVSIYSNPFSKGSNTKQNLYITNNKDKPITFKFQYKDGKVKVSVYATKPS